MSRPRRLYKAAAAGFPRLCKVLGNYLTALRAL